MDVVLPVLELLDYLPNQDDHELGDSIEVALAQLLARINLAVESVEADIDEALDLKLTEKVAQGPVFLRHSGSPLNKLIHCIVIDIV